jgi:ABC-type transport system involved in multi-copper enzyme maturation permease subunit
MKLSWFSLYNTVLALWVGGIVLFTFVVTPAIFRSFGRDLAGEIVGKLFPGYFLYLLVLAAAAFILFFTVAGDQSRATARLSFILLIAALVINVAVTFTIHPAAVKAKQRISSFELESPDSAARRQFARLHALSAALNLLVLADGLVLLLLGPALRK